ncbi:uncharacterized protein PG986_008722 [Apiospora aurea]|uniref:Uncharacterized protein n=1 Tax=Apiospora aurea TaxID=335848 RepID=A0ABR1Q5K2_9PEZI
MLLATDGDEWEHVPPHVVGLALEARRSFSFNLDTALGAIYWPVLDDAVDYATEEVLGWRRDGPAWAVTDFFEQLKGEFRQLNFVPVGPRRVDDDYANHSGETGDGSTDVMRKVYRKLCGTLSERSIRVFWRMITCARPVAGLAVDSAKIRDARLYVALAGAGAFSAKQLATLLRLQSAGLGGGSGSSKLEFGVDLEDLGVDLLDGAVQRLGPPGSHFHLPLYRLDAVPGDGGFERSGLEGAFLLTKAARGGGEDEDGRDVHLEYVFGETSAAA